MTAAEFRLSDVSLDRCFRGPDARAQGERAIAILGLLEENMFRPVGHAGGAHQLHVGMAKGLLALSISDAKAVPVITHHLSLTPFRRLLRDYSRICETYYDAIRYPGPERLEAIEMGRRGIHNRAAELLKERLSTGVSVDQDTARRLFSLIHALFWGSDRYRFHFG
ncbi:UPF0262 family protein [Rhizobium jaguaris]|uniref:UPF0262 family protein n=1 Tax=Rhizobium jaguaris TaxID=1312183 RepID=A0A387G179_9HYPH|nr:UPF0262 family protein [Rhizobium jaguaris]AYG64298.1 UPF0262 family protein [Rhizobium jaguaris]